ncbi:MAG: Obg family GTPase CgtA, partial [Erysipelotrichaceae bacterium]|nr:Obg family GTPase CgtA [Erysipelotrichaceae bacterium]
NLEAFRKMYPDLAVYPTTALIAEGLKEVIYKVADLLDVTAEFPLTDEENVGVLYKYTPEPDPFTIRNLGNGKWSLEGDEINKLFKRTDFEDEQQALAFALALKRMGVDDAMREKGVQPNDSIFIGDYVFEFTEFSE